MKAVEASAKTREEAIQIALKDLGVEMYEVDHIEVLDEGSNGLFGFGARPVRIRAQVDKLVDEPTKPAPKQQPRRERPRREENRGQQGKQESREEREPRGGRGRGRGRNNERAEQRSEGRKESPKPSQARAERPERKAPQENRPQKSASEEDVVAAISDEQGKEAAALLQEIINKMGLEAVVAFTRTEDESARLAVESEDGAILIGRKGRNLSAMQYLVNRMISKGDRAENTERLVVDVEGYVDRRRASLEDMARSMAAKAKDTGRNMRLKPLSPQERRIVHLALQDDSEIRTFSLGESLYRSIVISAKDGKNEGRNEGRGDRGRRGGRGRGRGRSDGNQNQKPKDDDIDPGQFGD